MTASLFKTVVLPPILLSGFIFSLMIFPVTLLSSKQIEIQLQKEPIFSGKIRDIAAPYLGLASTISLAAAVTTISITGWQRSTEQKHQTQQQLSNLQQQLKAEAQLDELKLSHSMLKAKGLDYFLEDPLPIPDRAIAVITNQ